MISRKINFLLESVPVLCFVGLAYLVLSQATNIPFWDEWFVPTLFDRYYSGTLTLEYLIFVHGDHVLAFPQAVVLLLGSFTHWDVRLELFINLILGVGIYLLYRYVFLNYSTQTYHKKILLPVLGIFVFSFIQWHNWIWGWQMQIFISIFSGFVALAILCLGEMNLKNILMAAFFSVIANFSFASGTSLWFIGAFLIARRSHKPVLYFLWAIPSGVCLYIYYLIRPKKLGIDNFNLFDKIEYVITYIGNPVSAWGEKGAFYMGLLGMVWLAFYLFFNRRRDSYSLFFLSVIAFVVATAILTSLGRPNRFDEATISRYSSFPIHFWIAIICLWFNANGGHHSLIKGSTYASVLLLSICSLIISYQSIHYFYVKEERTMLIQYLLDPQSVPEQQVNFRSVIWNRAYLERQVVLLKKYQLSLFYLPSPPR